MDVQLPSLTSLPIGHFRGAYILEIEILLPGWHANGNHALEELIDHFTQQFFKVWFPSCEVQFPCTRFWENFNSYHDICLQVAACCFIASDFDMVPNDPQYIETQAYIHLEDCTWNMISAKVRVEFIPAYKVLTR